jgi:hypothetical protein
MKSLSGFLISLFLIGVIHVSAQNIEVGAEFGLGPSEFSSIKNTFKNIDSKPYSLGLTGSYTPKSAIFSIGTGILYLFGNNSSEGQSLKMIQIPVGCDIKLGKKLFIIGGLGLYINGLIDPEVDNIDYPAIQLGLYVNAGLGYKFNEKWSFDLKYKIEHDLTKLYTKEYPNHLGGNTKENFYGNYGMLCFNLRYKI